jgi:hypothetical protein
LWQVIERLTAAQGVTVEANASPEFPLQGQCRADGNLHASEFSGRGTRHRECERQGKTSMKLSRLRAIARKEFIQIRRDKATMYMVFIFPVMMLVLYGFGIRYDVKSVPMTILDQDRTQESRQYIERFTRSPYFAVRHYVENYGDLQRDIDRGKSRIGLVVSADFSSRISSYREAVVQWIVDGADNNTATIAMNYVAQITASYSRSIMLQQMETVLRQNNLTIQAIEASRESGSTLTWKAFSSSCRGLSLSS